MENLFDFYCISAEFIVISSSHQVMIGLMVLFYAITLLFHTNRNQIQFPTLQKITKNGFDILLLIFFSWWVTNFILNTSFDKICTLVIVWV